MLYQRCFLLVLLVVGVWTGAAARGSAEPFRSVAKGSWKGAATWDRGAGFPGEGDSATIEGQTVLVDHDLTGVNAPDLIVLGAGGVMVQPGNGHKLASGVVMSGGTWMLDDHWSADRFVTGNVTLAADSILSGDRGTVLRVQGLMRGEHKLTVAGRDAYKGSGMTLSLERNNPHTGGIALAAEPPAKIVSAAPQALGFGPVELRGGELYFSVDPDYADETPPTVSVHAGATIKLDTPTIHLPIVFDGGRIGTNAGAGARYDVTGPIHLTERGMFPYTARNRYVIFRGPISGPGGVRTLKNDYYFASNIATSVVIAGDRNTYSGGTFVETAGGLQVTGDQALGTGPVRVNSAGIFAGSRGGLRGGLSIDVPQHYAAGKQPLFEIGPAGALYVNLPDGESLDLDLVLRGGELTGAWRDDRHNQLAGQVTLTADSFLGGAAGSLEVVGPIRGDFRLTRRVNIDSGEGLEKKCRQLPGPVILSNPENAFRELHIEAGPVGATLPAALGRGAITLWPAGSLLLAGRDAEDWVLTNELRGNGAIQVENGTPGFTLTLLGSVARPAASAPPTRIAVDSAPAIPSPASEELAEEQLLHQALVVRGNFAFAATEARPAVLCIEIGRHEGDVVSGRLHVAGVVSGLQQATLDVVVSEEVSADDLAGCELTVLTAGAPLGNQRFAAVNWDPAWQGEVRYEAGSVRLGNFRPTAEVQRREARPLRFGELLAPLAPPFSTAAVGVGGLMQLESYAGRERVLRTHPVSPDLPCILRGPVRLPAEKKSKLLLEVASRQPAGDWLLVVKANGRTLREQRIAASGENRERRGWVEVTVDLSQFAGQKVLLEVENRAMQWAAEDAFWRRVEVVSE